MPDDPSSFRQNSRLIPALNVAIGTLMIALGFLDTPVSSIGIGEIAVLLGGSVLVAVGLLGVWRPVRWGIRTDDRWIAVSYVLAVVLLVAAVVIELI